MPSEFHNREPPLPFGNPKSRPWYSMDIFWNRPLCMQDCKDESQINNYQWIQLSNNNFKTGILVGTLNLA